MNEKHSNEKRTMNIYIVYEVVLSGIALVFLVAAAFLEGRENIGNRFVLILIGACLLIASITVRLLRPKPEKKGSQRINARASISQYYYWLSFVMRFQFFFLFCLSSWRTYHCPIRQTRKP